MDLLRIGSASQYAKNMARRTQWELKKRSGDFTSHKGSLGDYVNFTKASSVLPETDEADNKLSAIMTKAEAGKKLSPDEWEYLKAKHPQLYEKLKEAEQEQESYEKALRRCKTKDEAQRLHVSKLGDIMTAAKNGDSGALIRLNRMTRTMIAFTESKEYRGLPTEAEQAIEREREREAKQEALRAEMELREAEKDAASQSAEDADAETVADETDAKAETVSDTENGAKAETASDTERAAKREAVSKAEIDAKRETVSKAKREADAAAKTKTESASYPADLRRFRTAKRKQASVPENHGAASGVAFGKQAYLNQRSGETRANRRKAVDAKA